MDQHTDGHDAHYLRLCFEVACQSRANGRHPFGAILVGPEGAVLLEQDNGTSEHERDMTAVEFFMSQAGSATAAVMFAIMAGMRFRSYTRAPVSFARVRDPQPS